MQTRCYPDMKTHGIKNKLSILSLVQLLFMPVFCLCGDVPIERDFLRLPDQRWIWLEKMGWHSTRITLGRGKKSFKNRIWSEIYETGLDEKRRHSWAYAFFIKMEPDRFVTFDSNKNPQVAISTYDMGNGVIRWAILFRVKKGHLEIADEIDGFNVAADEPLFHGVR